jgi:thiol-disulfide isomerase/thioredoxin
MCVPEIGDFMRRLLLVFVLVTIGSAAAFAQPAPPASSSEGFELLKKVAQQYAEANSYYIESVEERTTTTEYSHSWQKTITTAAQAPGDRFHYEGHSSSGSAMKVADGKTAWIYSVDEQRYTAKPQSLMTASKQIISGTPEWATFQAQNLRRNLGDMAKSLKSADRLPDATLVVNGHEVSCNVVRVQNSDQKRLSPDYRFDKTIWIDKTHMTFVKTIEHADAYLFLSSTTRIPMEEEIITVFTRAELNNSVHDELFTFIPPSDAKLIEDYPDPRNSFGGTHLTGDQVPSLKLKSADGKVVSIESFRGKPVLLDFWATWCGPCVEDMPQLAQLNAEANDKGLVLLLIDEDEDAPTATAFLSKKGYNWTDFHDGDGEIEKLVGEAGIPRTILIDANGKITYDASGMDEDKLRTEIAKLGPEYASLAPKPKQAPCMSSK